MLVLVFSAELLLRFLPVCTAKISKPVNEGNPVRRAEPNQTYVWSKGWNLSLVNRVHTNNYGFVNEQDYETQASTPLVAVIGDSYVEALMVPYADSIGGRLAAAAGPSVRVYSFAASGAPLSEYLAYAEYAASKFGAKRLVIAIVGNDFDESLPQYRKARGLHVFAPDGKGGLTLQRVDSSGSRYAWLLRRSRLANYLFRNLQLFSIGERLRNLKKRHVANTDYAPDPERIEKSCQVIEAFLAELPRRSGLEPGNTLFLLDGIRPDLYDPGQRRSVAGSYFGVMRDQFLERAQRRGFKTVDLEPLFIEQHRLSGARMEFKQDAHWNSSGHALAAQAVIESGWLVF